MDEAVDFLIEECLSKNYIQKIKNETPLMPIKRSFKNHFGINMFLRNLFFYPKNEKLNTAIREYNDFGASRGEHGEGIIANVLWRRLNNCEASTSSNKEKIEILQQQVDEFHKQFFAEKGLVIGKMTFDAYENVMDEFLLLREKNNINTIEERLKLLSYNFNEEQIDRYLSITVRDETFLEDSLKKEVILSNVKKEDISTLKKLKDAYFNTLKVVETLKKFINDKAESFSQTWRDKQLEYSFRRGLMQNYENFAVCTSQVNDARQPILWIAQSAQQPPSPI